MRLYKVIPSLFYTCCTWTMHRRHKSKHPGYTHLMCMGRTKGVTVMKMRGALGQKLVMHRNGTKNVKFEYINGIFFQGFSHTALLLCFY